jgi:hypothetical protein
LAYFEKYLKQKKLSNNRVDSELNINYVELKCGKFGTEQKITRLECDTHKKVRANRVKLCKRTARKLRAMKKRVQSRPLW